MKKSRWIFYGVFALFHVIAFFFTLYIDSNKNDIQFLISLQSKIGLMKFITLFGMLLITVDILWLLKDQMGFRKEVEKGQIEIKALKAKLFDYQEGSQKKDPGLPGKDSE